MELTEGTLLGGRIRYRQPAQGFRTGIEPVLLAASIAARPGERVLEGGTGAGAALLCLLARLPGLDACGVEQDGPLADLARANLAENRLDTATIEAADLLTLAEQPPFDHAMANPPWHDARGTASADPRREHAKRASPGLLAEWAAALARHLRPGGSLTFILPAASAPAALDALAASGCGGPALLPLWPRAGDEARLLLLRAIKGSRAPCRILSGLVLHEDGGYSTTARAILWKSAPVRWE